jgi:membrane protein required for colicin V production
MPITILDLVLLAVMLISGLLAMVRGFMREILSIAAWGAAALVTLYAYAKLLPTAKTYFNSDAVAGVVVVAGVFIGTLIVVSIVTVRISDMILDSRIGALDRTLGFQLAGSRQAAAGLGDRGEVPGGAAGNRRLADGALAG